MAATPLSAFRLTETDLAKLRRIREALDAQIPPGVRKVTITDALRHAIDGTATAHSVSVILGSKGDPPAPDGDEPPKPAG